MIRKEEEEVVPMVIKKGSYKRHEHLVCLELDVLSNQCFDFVRTKIHSYNYSTRRYLPGKEGRTCSKAESAEFPAYNVPYLTTSRPESER